MNAERLQGSLELLLTLSVYCLIVFLPGGCKSGPDPDKPVEKIQYYGTGEVSRRFFEVNGKKEGEMKDFYPNGSLKAIRLFENDIQIGRTVIYYPGGQIKETQYYADGMKEGSDTVFYESGQPQLMLNFHEDKQHGYVRKWSPEGELIFEARYEMDSLVEVKGEAVRRGTGVHPVDTVGGRE